MTATVALSAAALSAAALPAAFLPAAGGSATAKHRCWAWLSAVALLMLIAAAGLSASHERVTTGVCIEVVERVSVRALHRAFERAVLGAMAHAGVVSWPRPWLRTRSVLSFGLLPSRAPPA